MTATVQLVTYDRQISTDSGWDNPFRPGGDLAREADEIVNMIKGGLPITPTGDAKPISNGPANQQNDVSNQQNGTAVVDGATKVESQQLQSAAKNGTKSPQSAGKTPNDAIANGGDKKTISQAQVSNQVIPGPTSASHVIVEDDKKKKKCACCVIQ